MATIGSVLIDPKTGQGKGQIQTLQYQFRLKLAPTDNDLSKNPDLPSHEVIAVLPDGREVPIGAVWRKVAETGANKGSVFYSATLDDPSMERPLNLHFFQNRHVKPEPDKPLAYDVIWRRERAQQQAAA